jgi:hypothetical protein
MKRKIIFVTITFGLCLISFTAYTSFFNFRSKKKKELQIKDASIASLNIIFNELKKGCRYYYKATSHHPGNFVQDYEGCISIMNNNFIDSSNLQFSFQNPRWVFQAIHNTQRLRVYNIEKLKEQLGEDVEPNFSSSLLPDSNYLKILTVSHNIINDTLFVYLKNDSTRTGLKLAKFALPTNGKGYIPYYYTVDALYTDQYINSNTSQNFVPYQEGSNNDLVALHYNCYKISNKVNEELFDENNYIEISGNDAKMKVFKKYKINLTKN